MVIGAAIMTIRAGHRRYAEDRYWRGAYRD
jgi:hypothetical protein